MSLIFDRFHRFEHIRSYSAHLSRILEGCIATDGSGRILHIDEAMNQSVKILQEIKSHEKKALLVGNGGSAAIMAHMQNDLLKADRVKAMVLTETSLLTALTNDDGYEVAYSFQVDAWGESNDLLIAVSSSGKSKNILNSVRVAKEKEMYAITLSGFSPGNPLREMGDINFFIPSFSYGMVELSHSILCHYLTDRIAKTQSVDTQAPRTAIDGSV